MGARARLAWVIRGGPSTTAALDSLSVDLRDLQLKVDGIERALNDLRQAQAVLDERQLDGLDSIRTAVAAATDDLVARVVAIDERTQSST